MQSDGLGKERELWLADAANNEFVGQIDRHVVMCGKKMLHLDTVILAFVGDRTTSIIAGQPHMARVIQHLPRSSMSICEDRRPMVVEWLPQAKEPLDMVDRHCRLLQWQSSVAELEGVASPRVVNRLFIQSSGPNFESRILSSANPIFFQDYGRFISNLWIERKNLNRSSADQGYLDLLYWRFCAFTEKQQGRHEEWLSQLTGGLV